MTVIAVYQDYVHNNGSLIKALQERDIIVQMVDAQDIINGALDVFDAFIMPGGADLYYCEKLNGAGNTKIRDYVENGGAYLGICAGAYYACMEIDWNNGEIAGSRDLQFIDAKAVGPILPYMQGIDQSWHGAVPMIWETQEFLTLYNAGPRFVDVKEADVLARYADGEPAVIGCGIGKGKVIISSPHIEVSGDAFQNALYKHKSKHAVWDAKVAEKLAPHTDTQNAFFDFILRTLITTA